MNDSFAVRKRSRALDRKNRTQITSFLRGLELDVLEHVEFFQAFIREPASVGALSPSSRALALAMIEGFALHRADTIVELGAGTGAFTGPILERIGKNTSFFAMELDRIHARGLKRRFPGLTVYNDSAERLTEYLALQQKQNANYIVSGLPYANIAPDIQDRLMEAVLGSLAPTAISTTF